MDTFGAEKQKPAWEDGQTMLAHLPGWKNPDQRLNLILVRADISRRCFTAMPSLLWSKVYSAQFGKFLEHNLYDNVLISVSPQPGTGARPTASRAGPSLSVSPRNQADALEALARTYYEIVAKHSLPASQNGPHNQKESKPAIEAEVVDRT
jgi:hypothetical protein